MNKQSRETVLALCDILYKKNAQEIIAVDVADKTIVAEWFIICSGRTQAQVKALAEELDKQGKDMGIEAIRREGYTYGRWIVVDYGNILVHIFHPEERQYYNMERLWIDTPEKYIDYSAEKDKELEGK